MGFSWSGFLDKSFRVYISNESLLKMLFGPIILFKGIVPKGLREPGTGVMCFDQSPSYKPMASNSEIDCNSCKSIIYNILVKLGP